MKRLFIPFLFIVFFYESGFCQYSETISSDRPGATYSAKTIGARVLQFQVGGNFVSGSQEYFWTERTLSGWQFDGMVRVGVLERLEIGFPVLYQSLTPVNFTLENDRDQSLLWGMNLRGNVLKSNGKTPDIGMFVEFRFPDAETQRFSDGVYQLFLLNISQPLERRITLSSSIGMARHLFAEFVYTLNLNVKISPRTSLFVEHYGTYRREYGSSAFVNEDPRKFDFWYARVNGGFAIRVADNFLVDVQAGYGEFGVAPTESSDWLVGVGISYRVRFKKRNKAA